MNSSQRAIRPAGAAVRADLSGREPASTLAGLIDVLDRADGGLPRQRTRPAAHRSGARPVPLRSVQPAPSARAARRPVEAPRTPRVVVVPERVRQPLGGLRGVARRAALWGGGDQGEYLAWRTPAFPAPVRGRRRAALRAFSRRMALWGAGDQGEHLAWSSSASSAPTRPVVREIDPPVVLRELPSTPSIQPVASSPAAALLPAGPASSPGSRTGPAAPDATARPTPHPSSPEPTDRSQPRVGWRPPRDWPSSGRYGARSTPPSIPVRTSGPTSRTPGMPARRSPRGSGGAGARGDPSGCPVRGSPLPPRRAGPANGLPAGPFPPRAPSSHPRPAPRAPS
ncbi:hypothetical protein [Blastococcus saxobsidens]|uniref:Uncharacterized protein n=1 Tax=Blastococcus saxobsidens (strain DD2) TaxID=1146883 RepID=H6RK70_BLASD|nr:hypothetical protein [Blastococcus saxobsidens]CCG01093.1 conserved protein of unknown function [Blastococcus saxobsidens DD2]